MALKTILVYSLSISEKIHFTFEATIYYELKSYKINNILEVKMSVRLCVCDCFPANYATDIFDERTLATISNI